MLLRWDLMNEQEGKMAGNKVGEESKGGGHQGQ